MERILSEIEKEDYTGSYTLINEVDISKLLIDDFVGWVESKDISEKGIKKSGNRLVEHVKIPRLNHLD